MADAVTLDLSKSQPIPGAAPPVTLDLSKSQPIPQASDAYGFTPSNLASNAWQGVKELGGGIAQMGKDVIAPEGNTEGERIKFLLQKYLFNPSDVEEAKARALTDQGGHGMEAFGHALAGAIPVLGPWAAGLGEQAGTGDIGGALARGGAQVAVPQLAGKAIGATAGAVKEGALPLAQKYMGVGEDMTREALAKQAAETGEATAAHTEKAKAIEQANQANREAVQQRQSLHADSLNHASNVAEQLPDLKNAAVTEAKAAYPQISGTVKPTELASTLRGVADTKLMGSEKMPTVLKRIIEENEVEKGKSTGPAIGGRTLDLSNPNDLRAYARYKASGAFTPEEIRRVEGGAGQAVDFQKLHGYYSELGQEAYGRNIPGDERAALISAQQEVGSMMRKLADAEGKLPEFNKAQAMWKDVERTFNKATSDKNGVASPVARALQLKHPDTGALVPERVHQLLTNDSQYKLAQDMLAKYKHLGDASSELQLMKETMDQAKTLPDKLTQKPIPEAPGAPEPIDPQALKAQKIQEIAHGMRSMGGIRGAFDMLAIIHALGGNPASLLYPIGRRLGGYGLGSEAATGWLSKPSAAELEMVKPSQVHMSQKAAAKAGQRP